MVASTSFLQIPGAAGNPRTMSAAMSTSIAKDSNLRRSNIFKWENINV
jgi:hypothetical protein